MNLPSEAAMNGVWSALRSLLLVAGTIMDGAGIATTSPMYKAIELLAGTIMIAGPAVYSFVAAINRAYDQVNAVQAGINLAHAGQVKMSDGRTVGLADGDTMPVPVTVQSAKAIVEKFGAK